MIKISSISVLALVSCAFISNPAYAKPQQPISISANAAELTIELDKTCREQLKGQYPSGLKTVLVTALRNAPGAFLGGMAGAALGGFAPHGSPVSNIDYGLNTAASIAGSSIGAGFTAQAYGKKYGQGACMTTMLASARRVDSLRDVRVINNAFPVNGRAPRGPNGEKLGQGDYFLVTVPSAMIDQYAAKEPGNGDTQTTPDEQEEIVAPPPQP